MPNNVYWQLIGVFAPLSLLSFGGGQSVIADMNAQVVQIHQWSTQSQFVDMFALSRAAPGPGALLVTLIGWRVSGFLGAAIASLSLFLPSSIVAYAAIRLWSRHQGHQWHGIIERALTPIAAGLILSGALTLLRAVSATIVLWFIAGIAASIFLIWPKLNPMVVLVIAGVVYLAYHQWA